MSDLFSTTTQHPASTTIVYSVSQLNGGARQLLETHFGMVWVRGEISNLAKPASGHLYFSLKDESAQVRCAMFRTRNRAMSFVPQDGMDVLLRASVSVYEARGDYQLIVDFIELAGDGLLRRQFEQLKQKLADEGLFDEAHKQYLPDFPRCIGVLTSPSGAAVRDVLSVLKRRFSSIPVIIYPIPVQGNDAPPRIADMIRKAATRAECDVLILTRGGGTLEDLWAFNDEVVARTIYQCGLPIVTGIGHEIDFTIADFVADVRAPTPSAAAEMVSPRRDEYQAALMQLNVRMQSRLRHMLQHASLRLEALQKRVIHPSRRIQISAQRCDELEQRLRRAHQNLMRQYAGDLKSLQQRFLHQSPLHRITQFHASLRTHRQQIINHMQQHLHQSQTRMHYLARTLDNISPLKSLSRGYAIVQTIEDGKIVRHSGKLSPGDEVKATVQHGSFNAVVKSIHDSQSQQERLPFDTAS